jgi:hypothetical protein
MLASLKEEIKKALLERDFEEVAQRSLLDKKVFRVLISLAYDKEDLLCWRAIEAMGKAAGAIAERDPSVVRDIVQRLLWSVREESGGIGWSAPEMMAEIAINSPVICADIPPIILSFHEEESFLKGVLWAMGRTLHAGLNGTEGVYEVARGALDHKDPSVRGLALRAIPEPRIAENTDAIRDMTHDEGRFALYEDHELVETRVGDIARKVLHGRKKERQIEA